MSETEELRAEIIAKQTQLRKMSREELIAESERIKNEVSMWSVINPFRAKDTVPSGVNFIFSLIQMILEEKEQE